MNQTKSKLGVSLFYPGNKTGVLLVHGFTSSPRVLERVGKYLHRRGYTVSIPLLAGHGTTPSELAKTKWQDWYKSIEDAYFALRKECDSVIVIGFSFGGTLGAYLATQHRIKGLMLFAAPRWLKNHYRVYLMVVFYSLFGFKYYKQSIKKHMADPLFLQIYNLSYSVFPVRSVGQMLGFLRRMSDDLLRKIKVPTFIIQSTKDDVVNPKSGQFFYEYISSQEKQLVWIETPHHLVQKRGDERKIYNFIDDFMAQFPDTTE